MRRTSEGAIGTSCGGNSRKAALKRNLWALIKANDVLKVHERRLHEIHPDVLNVCQQASTAPSMIQDEHKRMIGTVWQQLAEAGKLHGIRNAPVQKNHEATQPEQPANV